MAEKPRRIDEIICVIEAASRLGRPGWMITFIRLHSRLTSSRHTGYHDDSQPSQPNVTILSLVSSRSASPPLSAGVAIPSALSKAIACFSAAISDMLFPVCTNNAPLPSTIGWQCVRSQERHTFRAVHRCRRILTLKSGSGMSDRRLHWRSSDPLPHCVCVGCAKVR